MNLDYVITGLALDVTLNGGYIGEVKQLGTVCADVDLYVDGGQRAITSRAPEDCQEGIAPSVEINRVTAKQPIVLEGDGMTLTVAAGTLLTNLLDAHVGTERLEAHFLGVLEHGD
jgi:hypothetical protein